MTEGSLIVQRKGGILYLTLSNPKSYNAITMEMREELVRQLDAAEHDDKIHVIVLRGDGEKAFSSGLSMEMLDEIHTTDDRIMQWELDKACCDALHRSTKITIAEVKGVCAATGFEYVMCCDLILCAENARFMLPELNIGLTPGCGGAITLHRLIPKNRFMEMVLFGDSMSAAEAYDWGFANKVYPLDTIDEEIVKLANKLQGRPPLAVRGLKDQMVIQVRQGMEAAYRKEYELSLKLMSSNDFKGAVKAFRNKEPFEFKGN